MFSPALYKKYDATGKGALTEYLVAFGMEVTEHPFGQYGIDLQAVTPDGEIIYLDAEVRNNWKTGKFPYSTIHIPERKRKFAKDNCFFVSIRKDLKSFIFISGSCLAQTVESSNKYMDNETFFDINVRDGDCVNYSNEISKSHCHHFNVYLPL
jgi:hypothetical protein